MLLHVLSGTLTWLSAPKLWASGARRALPMPAKPAKPASTMATAPALPFSQEPIQDMG